MVDPLECPLPLEAFESLHEACYKESAVATAITIVHAFLLLLLLPPTAQPSNSIPCITRTPLPSPLPYNCGRVWNTTTSCTPPLPPATSPPSMSWGSLPKWSSMATPTAASCLPTCARVCAVPARSSD